MYSDSQTIMFYHKNMLNNKYDMPMTKKGMYQNFT